MAKEEEEQQQSDPDAIAARSADPFVSARRPDPNTVPEPTSNISGLLGDSDRTGRRRLYFNTRLDYYVEFEIADVIAVEDVPPEQPPFPGLDATRVALRRGARVDYVYSRVAGEANEFDLDISRAARFSAELHFGPPRVLPPFDQSFNVCPWSANTVCNAATCTDPATGLATVGGTCGGTCNDSCGGTCGDSCLGTCQQVTCAGTCNEVTCQGSCFGTCGEATCGGTCGRNTCGTCGRATCNRQTCATCGRATCEGQTCFGTCGEATCFGTCGEATCKGFTCMATCGGVTCEGTCQGLTCEGTCDVSCGDTCGSTCRFACDPPPFLSQQC